MALDISGVKRLSPGLFRLKRGRKGVVPKPTNDVLQAIRNFARFMGLVSIPKKTVEKLRTDPFFIYCFCGIMDANHSALYEDSHDGKIMRRIFIEMLRNPDSVLEKDLFLGLSVYLNNFIGYMPEGDFRSEYKKDPVIWQGHKSIFESVDNILTQRNQTQKAIILKKEADAESEIRAYPTPYSKRLEHMKLCLEIFDILIQDHNYNPDLLWA